MEVISISLRINALQEVQYSVTILGKSKLKQGQSSFIKHVWKNLFDQQGIQWTIKGYEKIYKHGAWLENTKNSQIFEDEIYCTIADGIQVSTWKGKQVRWCLAVI